MTQQKNTSLEVAIAAGGTAGHINPAIAVAEELRDRGHHVTFYGQSTRLEARLVPAAGFDFVAVDVRGFDRSRPWLLVPALIRIRLAVTALKKHFRTAKRPHVAIGFGAYVELPLLIWCRMRGVPYLLHEQNSVPGLANRMLASRASTVCISVAAAKKAFASLVRGTTPVVLTGNPVRRCVIEGDALRGRNRIGAPSCAKVLLIFGGSLGARHLNNAVSACKAELLARKDLFIVHSTGAAHFEETQTRLALTPEEQLRWHVVPYIDDIGDLLQAADIIVARAGASSVAEIAAVACPSLLVPYPLATADHQTINARFLVDAGAASCVADEALDTSEFRDALFKLIDDTLLCAKMRLAAKKLGSAQSAIVLADTLENVAYRRTVDAGMRGQDVVTAKQRTDETGDER